jgi:hypothetical protein
MRPAGTMDREEHTYATDAAGQSECRIARFRRPVTPTVEISLICDLPHTARVVSYALIRIER